MVTKGLDRKKFAWLPNGFSLDEVNKKIPLDEAVKSQIPQNKFIVGYTGTLGVANSLHTLIAAAEIVKENTDIAFVLVGRGKEKADLQKLVKDKQLTNIVFIEAIPKVQIQAMLQEFDACFIGWLNDDLYKFGIGANKIPEYLYSGKPVLHAYSGACDPFEENSAGFTVKAESPLVLADAILELYSMPKDQREKMGENGHKAAMEQYEYGMLAKRFAELVFG
jgi:glycosyltransferase involved in cell wall biosynthesis